MEWVDADDQGRMVTSALPPLDERTLVIAQAGNVDSGAFDPLAEICERARAARAWVQVDGAFGMWAGAVEGLRHLTRRIEQADSWAVDGHKTLNTPYDSGIARCRDAEALTCALHMSGGYIVLSEARDGMLYTPEMSRRARAVELWATLKHLGLSGLEQIVYGLHERAVQLAEALGTHPGFRILNDVVFNQVLVGCGTDEQTARVLERVQAEREC